jgi:hypothetical protein
MSLPRPMGSRTPSARPNSWRRQSTAVSPVGVTSWRPWQTTNNAGMRRNSPIRSSPLRPRPINRSPIQQGQGPYTQAIAQNQEATAGFWGLFAQTMLPGEFFSEQHVRTLLQSPEGR